MANEKSEAQLELDELAKADDGSNPPDGEEDENEEGGGDGDDGKTPARDSKSGKFVKAEGGDDDGKKTDGKKAGGKKDAAADGDADEDADGDADEDADEDEDEDEDGDEDEDEGDADENEENDESPTKGKSVPLSRFSKVVGQKNELARRNAELEAQLKQDDKKDDKAAEELKTRVTKLYEDIEEARADNDTKKAAALQRELDDLRDQQAEIRTRKAARDETRATFEETEFDRLAAFIEQERPIINPRSKDYDPDVAEAFNFHVDAYMKNGDTPTKAIRRASKMIFEEDPLTTPRKVAEKKDDGKKEDTKDGKKPLVKKTDVKKNAEAQRKQPPKGDGSATPADGKTISVKQLTDEEFDALPESKKNELGGNYLTD